MKEVKIYKVKIEKLESDKAYRQGYALKTKWRTQKIE